MNKVDIIRKYIGSDNFYDMNGTSLLTNILNAMEEYKEQEVKNCSTEDVLEYFRSGLKSIQNIKESKNDNIKEPNKYK